MHVADLIKRDHDEVADLFDQLAAVACDDRRTSVAIRDAQRLVAAVRIHARSEERVLYEAMLTRSGPLKSFALAGPHEHEMLDITLDKLLVRRPSEEYAVIVKVARDLFEMHARDEEEADILPVLRELVTADEADSLARDLLAEQARLRPQILRLVGLPARAA